MKGSCLIRLRSCVPASAPSAPPPPESLYSRSGRNPLLEAGSAARSEFQNSRHQRINVAAIGAVVDDGGADREPAVEHRRRRRCDTGFLKIDDDLAIDPVGIVGAIAEANDVEIDRRQQLE